VGQAFKKDAKTVTEHLQNMTECDAMELKAKLETGSGEITTVEGQVFTVTSKMVDIKKELVRYHFMMSEQTISA
jgi:glycyl-tRNA synthetase (class II)